MSTIQLRLHGTAPRASHRPLGCLQAPVASCGNGGSAAAAARRSPRSTTGRCATSASPGARPSSSPTSRSGGS